MNEQKSKEYKKYIDLILEEFKAFKPYIIHKYDNVYLLKFKNRNLNKYRIEIWPVGGEDNYDSEHTPSICIFGIHKWRIDKVRPSSADWALYYEMDDLKSHYETNNPPYLLWDLEETLNCIKHNPIFSYFHFGETPEHNMYLAYARSFWNARVVGWYKNYIQGLCVPYLLFMVLYLISLFDRKIANKYILVNYWKNAYPSFTFGFPIKIGATEDAIYRRWKLYSGYPDKIIRGKAHFHVYEIKQGDTDKDIHNGLFRGIYFK
jgi:hypothetical protein